MTLSAGRYQAYRRMRATGRPLPSFMADEEDQHARPETKDTKMAHEATFSPETWGLIEWGLAAMWTVGGAMGLFLWRLQLQLLLLKSDFARLERETERRHQENLQAHNELVGELRNNRQSLESFHRDLTRRIDAVWGSVNGR